MFASKSITWLESFAKPIKQGLKVGKGFSAIITQNSDQTVSDVALPIGQSAGAILVSMLVLGVNRLMEKMPKDQQDLLSLSTYLGLSIGSCIGSFASNTILKNLPSSFNSVLGMVGGIAISTTVFMLIPFVYKKLIKKSVQQTATSPLTKEFYKQFNLGLTAGTLLGATLGAGFDFIVPGTGVVASAITAAVMAPIAGMLAVVAPKLYKRFCNKKTSEQNKNASIYSKTKYALGVGSAFGTAIGAMIGSFVLPVVGPVLGGIIGAGLGALAMSVTATAADKQFAEQLSRMQTYLKVGVPIGAAIGATIGSFVFPVIGTLAGAAIGSFLSCAVCSVMPLFDERKANPWFTTSIKQNKSLLSIGTALGGLAGGIVGTFIFPGIGTTLGAMLGAGMVTAAFAGYMLITKSLEKTPSAPAVKPQNQAAEQPNAALPSPPSSHQKIITTLVKNAVPDAKPPPDIVTKPDRVEIPRHKLELLKPRSRPLLSPLLTTPPRRMRM